MRGHVQAILDPTGVEPVEGRLRRPPARPGRLMRLVNWQRWPADDRTLTEQLRLQLGPRGQFGGADAAARAAAGLDPGQCAQRRMADGLVRAAIVPSSCSTCGRGARCASTSPPRPASRGGGNGAERHRCGGLGRARLGHARRQQRRGQHPGRGRARRRGRQLDGVAGAGAAGVRRVRAVRIRRWSAPSSGCWATRPTRRWASRACSTSPR